MLCYTAGVCFVSISPLPDHTCLTAGDDTTNTARPTPSAQRKKHVACARAHTRMGAHNHPAHQTAYCSRCCACKITSSSVKKSWQGQAAQQPPTTSTRRLGATSFRIPYICWERTHDGGGGHHTRSLLTTLTIYSLHAERMLTHVFTDTHTHTRHLLLDMHQHTHRSAPTDNPHHTASNQTRI